MGNNWTEKQLDAISADGTAVLVSAAAGSGKTSVLVERIIKRISDTENKIPADKMVIVTFTNDAAAQMKQRLNAALSDAIDKNPQNIWLCKQQSLLQNAKISTISSFCFDLIRENIENLDVAAGFRILEETENDVVLSDAIENAFEKFYKNSPDKMTLLIDFYSSSKRNDSELEANIMDLYKKLTAIPFYNEWLDIQLKNINSGFNSDGVFEQLALNEIKSIIKKCIKSAEKAESLCAEIADINAKINDKPLAAITSESDTLKKILCEIENDAAWDDIVRLCSSFATPTIYFSTKTLNDDLKENIPQIKFLRSRYKDLLGDMKPLLVDSVSIENDNKIVYNMLGALIELIGIYESEIKAIKSKKNALSFSDGEQLAIKLLAARDDDGKVVQTPLAMELSEYYKIIMIDEFQDSNNTQDLIFKLLSHNGSASKMGDNVFVVGDVKQSIYRFRFANPKLFLNALNHANTYCQDIQIDEKKAVKVLLNQNFRSSKGTVDFINFIFENIMSIDVGDIEYGDDEKLVLGASYPETDNDNNEIDRRTEIILVDMISKNTAENSDNDDTESLKDGDGNTEKAITKADVAEARAVAKKIYSMLGNTMVFDDGILRPSECKDFCILTRNNQLQAMYADMLSELNIKTKQGKPKGYLKSREVSVLINMLNIIDNPMQDIALVSVLMSPMFMFSPDDLARLKCMAETPKDAVYLTILKALDGENETVSLENTDELYQKLTAFISTFNTLRYISASVSLEKLIRTIYDNTDFLSAVQIYKNGKQKRANLHLLFNYAQSYEENSTGGLSGFLRFLSSVSDRDSDFSVASTVSSSENAVEIKTIHSSKGLEFPYVFLCSTSKRFNLLNKINLFSSRAFHFSYENGIGFNIKDREKLSSYQSVQYAVLENQYIKDQLSEEMRLLYVALTRAKERLFISIVNDEKTGKHIEAIAKNAVYNPDFAEDIVTSSKSMQEWLLAVLLRHKEFNRVISEKYESCVDIKCFDEKTVPEITVTVSDTSAIVVDDNVLKPYDIDEDELAVLTRNFNYKYDGENTETAAKLTITEIAKMEAEDDIYLRIPEFAADNMQLSAADKGTAMHTFMQFANFSFAQDDVVKEGKRLCDNGIISQIEYTNLDFKALERFFASDTYKRITNSDEVYRERKFLVEISELGLDDELGLEYNNTDSMLQGIIDCFFREGDGYVLIDYKTDHVNSPAVLVSRHERQLKVYSKAIEKIYGMPVKEAYLYSFCFSTEVQIDLS